MLESKDWKEISYYGEMGMKCYLSNRECEKCPHKYNCELFQEYAHIAGNGGLHHAD